MGGGFAHVGWQEELAQALEDGEVFLEDGEL